VLNRCGDFLVTCCRFKHNTIPKIRQQSHANGSVSVNTWRVYITVKRFFETWWPVSLVRTVLVTGLSGSHKAPSLLDPVCPCLDKFKPFFCYPQPACLDKFKTLPLSAPVRPCLNKFKALSLLAPFIPSLDKFKVLSLLAPVGPCLDKFKAVSVKPTQSLCGDVSQDGSIRSSQKVMPPTFYLLTFFLWE
jgi:hypothetical protein